jgi:hypothetical protein
MTFADGSSLQLVEPLLLSSGLTNSVDSPP